MWFRKKKDAPALLEIDALRTEFPLLVQHDVAYLDSAATAHKPRAVLDAEREYYEKRNANVHRGVYKLADESTQTYENARTAVASFFGAKPDEVVFTSGATHALNLGVHILDYALALKEGDEIVTTIAEHHSLFVPLQQVAKRTGATLVVVPLTDGTITAERISEHLTSKTKLIAVASSSNVLGYTLDVRKIKKGRAVLFVDACQSAAHARMELGHIDVLAVSAHKLYGPMGIGALVAKETLLEEGEPLLFGGSMIANVTVEDTTWAEPPARYEAGTPNVAGAVGFATALAFLQKNLPEASRREQELTLLAEETIKEFGTLIGQKAGTRTAPIISFVVDGVHAHDVAQVLDAFGVCVRAGQHCAQPLHDALGVAASVRVSLGMYTTRADIEKLREGLAHATKVLGRAVGR
jgi:cysteine desulfurase/selenocysteine lyase